MTKKTQAAKKSDKKSDNNTYLSVEIGMTADSWKKAFPKLKKKAEQAAALAFLKSKKPKAFDQRAFEITLILSTDATIKKLNRDYRAKDKATNVLSFPQFDVRNLKKKDMAVFPANAVLPLGDVVMALQTVKREAKEQGKTVEAHTIHLIVHGVLHLLGYDHMNSKDAKNMEKLESDILEILGYPHPYHETDAKII